MFSVLSDRCKDILNSLSLLTERSGAGKIAWVLDKLEEVGVDPTTVTHETIGRLLNMNRVSVTRSMSSALDQRLSK